MVLITDKMLDKYGQVTVYDLEAKAERRVNPIDAREMIRLGTACLPKDKERILAGDKKDIKQSQTSGEPAEAKDLDLLKVEKLREWAGAMGIPGAKTMRKREVIRALLELEFVIPEM